MCSTRIFYLPDIQYLCPFVYENSESAVNNCLKKYVELLYYLKIILYICIDNRGILTNVAFVALKTEHNYLLLTTI